MSKNIKNRLCGALSILSLCVSGVAVGQTPDYNTDEEKQQLNQLAIVADQNTVEAWAKLNPKVPQSTEELISQFMRYAYYQYSTKHAALFESLLKRDWEYFTECIVMNPLKKQNWGGYDAGYTTDKDLEHFYLLYGIAGKRAWGANIAGMEQLKADWTAIFKAYPNIDQYKTNELIQYHPYNFALRAFGPRYNRCVNRVGRILVELRKQSAFNADPLNKAKGLTYQWKMDQVFTPMTKTSLEEILSPKEDYTAAVLKYSTQPLP